MNAQQEKGIHFEQGLSWYQIQKKAKEENKYIFVDLYATWCGPCKQMDAEIYPKETVGNAINEKFISVKIQMDRTDNDNDAVKKWYNDAERLGKDYTISAYPSFLFFSPDGKPVHKSIGAKNEKDFLSLATDATNPEKQYFHILADYKPGVLDTAEMKGLALSYRGTGKELAEKIVLDYFSRIPASEKYSEDNLHFLEQFAGDAKIQDMVYDYLSGLSGQVFMEKKNRSLAVVFCNYNNLKVQDLCTNYINKLDPAKFINKSTQDSTNLKFIINLALIKPIDEVFARYLRGLSSDQFAQMMHIKRMENIVNNPENYPAIKNVILEYFEKIDAKALGDSLNMNLARGCKNEKKIQDLANAYIPTINAADLKQLNVILFIAAFTTSTKDQGFELAYNNLNNRDPEVKENMNKIVNYWINKEIVAEYLEPGLKGEKIPWEDIAARIKVKYPNVTDAYHLMMNSKLSVLDKLSKKDPKYFVEYYDCIIEKENKYNEMNDAALNSVSWDIFEKSNVPRQLNAAIKWMEGVVERAKGINARNMFSDTYANLLYKNGNVKEAIAIEPKSYETNYNKMLKGLPTWPEEKTTKN
ncbi:MAG: thioredoxin fold domain-containing protein [Bacteroidota bacterium]